MSLLILFLNALAPVAFLLNYPLAIASGIWLCCLGEWEFALAGAGGVIVGPYFMGILTSVCAPLINSAYRTRHLKNFKLILNVLWHWLGVAVWGSLVISTGLNAAPQHISLFPVMGLCLAVTTLPIWTVLRDAFKADKDEEGSLVIIILVFSEFAAISSLALYYIYHWEKTEVLFNVFYTFALWGLLEVPIHWEFLSELISWRIEKLFFMNYDTSEEDE